MKVDLDYLRMADSQDPVVLLQNASFQKAEAFFNDVLTAIGVNLHCDIADVREVHVMAALGDQLKGASVIDVGCGSFADYVEDPTDIRDNYPPLMAECLQRMGSKVTGVDIRPNPQASYDHRVLDVTEHDWIENVDAPYDVVICFSLFNAPDAEFKDSPSLSEKLMHDLCALLKSDGLLIATLPEHLFPQEKDLAAWSHNVRAYLAPFGLSLLHCGRTAVWAAGPARVKTADVV